MVSINNIVLVGVAVIVVALFGYYMFSASQKPLEEEEKTGEVGQRLRPTTTTLKTTTTTFKKSTVSPPVIITQRLPVDRLRASAKDKFTDAAPTDETIDIELWAPGADVSDPNSKPIDEVKDLTSGTGTSTSGIIQTNTNYDVWVNGSTTYYDELVRNWEISYNPDTGNGSLLVNGLPHYRAVAFGAFVDVNTLPEIISGGILNETVYENQNTTKFGTTGDNLKSDYILYDESVGAGNFWTKLDFGNANSNSEIWNYVLCFRDGDGDLEGDEITAITSAYVSGSRFNIPGDLLGYWRDGMGSGGKRCLLIADKVGSSEKGRYQFDFTVNEDNWAGLNSTYDTQSATNGAENNVTQLNPEEFEITQDDLGDFSKRQYPSSNLKATAESLTIASKA